MIFALAPQAEKALNILQRFPAIAPWILAKSMVR